MTPAEKVRERIVVAESGCWEWPGARNDSGYGQVWAEGRVQYVHRVLYHDAHGPIPDGFDVDHLCRNPPCANPDHLEAVTHAENIRRGFAAKGQTHCKRGHDLAVHARIKKDGARDCRRCAVERRAERRAA